MTIQDEGEVKKLDASAGSHSKLPKEVQDLVKIIFDVESMKKAMLEFEVSWSMQLFQYVTTGFSESLKQEIIFQFWIA